jgi:hypothetical protein
LSIVPSLEIRASDTLQRPDQDSRCVVCQVAEIRRHGERTVFMGLFQRLFGATLDALALPQSRAAAALFRR